MAGNVTRKSEDVFLNERRATLERTLPAKFSGAFICTCMRRNMNGKRDKRHQSHQASQCISQYMFGIVYVYLVMAI